MIPATKQTVMDYIDDAPRCTEQECLMVRPDFPNGVRYVMVTAEFARSLEREINELNQLIEILNGRTKS